MTTYSAGVPVWRVLPLFLDAPGQAFSPVEVAQVAGVPVRRVYPVLAGLCDVGIVQVVREAPVNNARRRLYQLCEDGVEQAYTVLLPDVA